MIYFENVLNCRELEVGNYVLCLVFRVPIVLRSPTRCQVQGIRTRQVGRRRPTDCRSCRWTQGSLENLVISSEVTPRGRTSRTTKEHAQEIR